RRFLHRLGQGSRWRHLDIPDHALVRLDSRRLSGGTISRRETRVLIFANFALDRARLCDAVDVFQTDCDFRLLARVSLLCLDLRILLTKGEGRQLAGTLSHSGWTLQLLLLPAPLPAHSDSRAANSPDRALQD